MSLPRIRKPNLILIEFFETQLIRVCEKSVTLSLNVTQTRRKAFPSINQFYYDEGISLNCVKCVHFSKRAWIASDKSGFNFFMES